MEILNFRYANMDFFKTPHIQIRFLWKDPVFKYEFLVLFIYPCFRVTLSMSETSRMETPPECKNNSKTRNKMKENWFYHRAVLVHVCQVLKVAWRRLEQPGIAFKFASIPLFTPLPCLSGKSMDFNDKTQASIRQIVHLFHDLIYHILKYWSSNFLRPG